MRHRHPPTPVAAPLRRRRRAPSAPRASPTAHPCALRAEGGAAGWSSWRSRALSRRQSLESAGTCEGTKLAPAWPEEGVDGRARPYRRARRAAEVDPLRHAAVGRADALRASHEREHRRHHLPREPKRAVNGLRRVEDPHRPRRSSWSRCVAIDRSVASRSCECTSAVDEPAAAAKYLCQTGQSGARHRSRSVRDGAVGWDGTPRRTHRPPRTHRHASQGHDREVPRTTPHRASSTTPAARATACPTGRGTHREEAAAEGSWRAYAPANERSPQVPDSVCCAPPSPHS